MVKPRFIKITAHSVLLAVVTGSANLMTGSSELATPSPVCECGSGGSSGGGC